MGPSRTVSETNGHISRKSPILPTTVYLTPPLKGFALEFATSARGGKTRMTGLPDGRKSFKIRFKTRLTVKPLRHNTGVWVEVCGSSISATRPVPVPDDTYPYPYPTRAENCYPTRGYTRTHSLPVGLPLLGIIGLVAYPPARTITLH